MDKEGKTVKIALKCTCISAVRGRESKKETDGKERERERDCAGQNNAAFRRLA